MKIVSDVGDPEAVVTNAEVAAFLEEKDRTRPKKLHDGGNIDRGKAALVSKLALKFIKASPAGTQTVDSVVLLRDKLAKFGLREEEFCQICNLRADVDDLLERCLTTETAGRLSDEQWEEIKSIIHTTLEPRPVQ